MKDTLTDLISTFCLALLSLCTGVLFILVSLSPNLKNYLVYLTETYSIPFFFFGLAFTLIAFALFAFFWQKTKRTYYRVKLFPSEVEIDHQLIKKLILTCTSKRFSNDEVSLSLSASPLSHKSQTKQFQLMIHLPSTPQAEQKSLTEMLTSEIKEILTLTFEQTPPLALTFIFAAD